MSVLYCCHAIQNVLMKINNKFCVNFYRPQRKPHPPDQWPPQSRHPACAVHAGRYGQQAGGMHPTGMQSCEEDFVWCLTNLTNRIQMYQTYVHVLTNLLRTTKFKFNRQSCVSIEQILTKKVTIWNGKWQYKVQNHRDRCAVCLESW